MQVIPCILLCFLVGASGETDEDGCFDSSSLLQRSLNRHDADADGRKKCCTKPCKWGNWDEWTQCSVTCGLGEKTRTRNKTVIEENCTLELNGTDRTGECNASDGEMTVECNLVPCKIHCVEGQWTEWSPQCPTQCGEDGTSEQTRTRPVITPAAHGGERCDTEQDRKCNATEPCPVPPCDWSKWSEWSPCDKTCGSAGTRTRSRKQLDTPEGCNKTLTPTTQTVSKECQPELSCCPTDCKVAEWGDWGECTATCGGGSRYRNRTTIAPECGGAKCPDSDDTGDCNTHKCPDDCECADWTPWGVCSQSCGDGPGHKTRTRECTEAKYGGKNDCLKVDNTTCNNKCCPVDCKWDWTEWGDCSQTCDTGVQTRSRNITTEPKCGGEACPEGDVPDSEGNDPHQRDCNTQGCPTPCEWEWTDWTTCPVTCGTAKQSRERIVTQNATNGGKGCTIKKQEISCVGEFGKCCPKDCVPGTWTEWTACSLHCNGEQTRTRKGTVQPECGGQQCPPDSENRTCNPPPCKCPCTNATCPWNDWSPCSGTCDLEGTTSHKTRTRTVPEEYAGMNCEDKETTECTHDLCCPQNCEMSEWAQWADCTRTCDGGTRSRSRSVLKQAKCGGVECQNTTNSEECHTQCCPQDCLPCEWGDWTTCPPPNQDKKTRTREIASQPTCGGKKCPPPEELIDGKCDGGTIVASVVTLRGTVKNVKNDEAVPGATVTIQSMPELTGVSDSKGDYEIDGVPVDAATGAVKVKVVIGTLEGWVPGSATLPEKVPDMDSGEITGVDVYMSQNLPPKDWRIILRWGMTPLDLDSRTYLGWNESNLPYDVFYKNRSVTNPKNQITGTLDLDHCFYTKENGEEKYTCNESSEGGPSDKQKPETTTLTNVDPDNCGDSCKIVFHVSNYMVCSSEGWGSCVGGRYPAKDTGTLEDSQATAEVIHGEKQVAFYKLANGDGEIRYGCGQKPRCGSPYTEWWVFAIDVKTGKVIDCKDTACKGP